MLLKAFLNSLQYFMSGMMVCGVLSFKDSLSNVDCKLTCVENVPLETPEELPSSSIPETTQDRKCQCGHSPVMERIINGEDVLNPGTYPWQALLIVGFFKIFPNSILNI